MTPNDGAQQYDDDTQEAYRQTEEHPRFADVTVRRRLAVAAGGRQIRNERVPQRHLVTLEADAHVCPEIVHGRDHVQIVDGSRLRRRPTNVQIVFGCFRLPAMERKHREN